MYSGTCIQSTTLLDGSIFEQAIIFITQHDAGGSVGFVVNKALGRTLDQLEEFKQCPPVPLYNGGPVDTEHLFFIHRRPDLIAGGTLVAGNIYMGGNFTEVVAHLKTNTLSKEEVKLFIGYCGWDDTELESEIAEGSWLVTDGGEVFKN